MSSSGPVSRLLAFGARDRLIESGLTIFTHHCWPSADLAAALGHLHDRNHPEVHAMIRKLLASITAAGKPAGILDVGNPEQAKMYACFFAPTSHPPALVLSASTSPSASSSRVSKLRGLGSARIMCSLCTDDDACIARAL